MRDWISKNGWTEVYTPYKSEYNTIACPECGAVCLERQATKHIEWHKRMEGAAEGQRRTPTTNT